MIEAMERSARVRLTRGLLWLLPWLSVACTGVETEDAGEDTVHENTAQIAQPLSQIYNIALPAGVGLGETALAAAGSLKLEDRTRVENVDHSLALVTNTGTTLTRVGVEARVGTVKSVATIDVRDRARIEGDAVSSGAITVGNNVTITGARRPQTSLAPLQQFQLEVDFSAPATVNVNLEPPSGPGENQTTLAPGRYGSVVVKSRNRVNLSAGTYIINQLQLEPQTRLVVDDSAGVVKIDVQTSLLYKGAIQTSDGHHPALRLAYVGTQDVVIEKAFTGTLLAPRASVRLATNSGGHVGSFFAKSLEVSPDNTIVFRPYFVFSATPVWEVSDAAFEDFGFAVAATDGSVVTHTRNDAIAISPAGVPRVLLANASPRRFLLDEASARWGFYTPSGFSLFDKDGNALGNFAMSEFGAALFIPGSTALAFVNSQSEHHEGVYFGANVTGAAGGSFALPGMEGVQAGPAGIVYTTSEDLVNVSLSGVERWRIPYPLRHFKIAENGSRLIGTLDEVGSRVIHVQLATGAVSTPLALDAAMYELMISPNGEHSLAATKRELYLFKGGTLARRIPLPLAYFTSADINNDGDVVVGGSDTNRQGLVQLIGPSGVGSWTTLRGTDKNAYRPFVTFKPQGGFVTVRAEGVTSYAVTRRL